MASNKLVALAYATSIPNGILQCVEGK
jgi:hypothetical protein